MSNLKNLKVIKSFDIQEYNGVKTKIASTELSEIESKDFGKGLVDVQQVLVKTENLAKEGEREFQVTEYISLSKDIESGEFGIPSSLKSNAQKILTSFKVSNFEELIGKECVVIRTVKDNGKEYLKISY